MTSPSLFVSNLRAGINRELTRYAGEGGWYDADKVRFRYGKPEKIGGWENIQGAQDSQVLPGVTRSILPWSALDGTIYVAVGTNSHLLLWNGGTYYDITPVRSSVSGTNIISTSADSTRVVVSVPNHDAVTGDYFYFTSITTSVGDLPTLVSAPFGGYPVSVIDQNSFAIHAPVSAVFTSISGGGATRGYFLIPTGNANSSPLFGWGAGFWGGSQGWGTPASAANVLPLRYWSLDNYGEDLVASYRGGPIYYWDKSSGTNVRAALVSTSPSQNTWILVSPEDRHLIAFGCPDAITSAYNPLYIRWCTSENLTDWNASATNTAGDKLLSGANKIISARRSRGQILVWTDDNLYGMQTVGPPFTFGFTQIGTNCGTLGPNAMVEAGGRMYWMADERFMVYDGGAPQILECQVLRYVFGRLDRNQLDKIYAGSNSAYNEIIWFYPSQGSSEIDSYVIYDYLQKTWSIGTMVRTAWVDEGLNDYPIASSYEGGTKLYYHEFNDDADGLPMDSYIESSLFDLDAGQELMFIDRIVPDFSDRNGDSLPGTVDITLKTLKYPNTPPAQEITKGPFTVSAYTQKIDMRVRGRHAYYRIEATGLGTSWRLGAIRFRQVKDGER